MSGPYLCIGGSAYPDLLLGAMAMSQRCGACRRSDSDVAGVAVVADYSLLLALTFAVAVVVAAVVVVAF